ncbi:MAG: division/cell wall cluster transcriptional repressor MraZ [Bacteroidia bacterium]
MKPLTGQFDCKVDAKGRFLMPSALRKQLPEDEQSDFVVNRGLEKCLVIYPRRVWDSMMEKIYAKNQFIEKNRRFARRFTAGSKELALDGSDRVLLPKNLIGYAGLGKEIVLLCQYNRVEVWDKAAFDAALEMEDEDFADLAEDVMGDDDGLMGML